MTYCFECHQYEGGTLLMKDSAGEYSVCASCGAYASTILVCEDQIREAVEQEKSLEQQ